MNIRKTQLFLSLSVRLSIMFSFIQQKLAKFDRPADFGPWMKAIKNGLNCSTFSTTSRIALTLFSKAVRYITIGFCKIFNNEPYPATVGCDLFFKKRLPDIEDLAASTSLRFSRFFFLR